ncbi:SUZ domain-containing protein 1 [Caerostris darwini]|uniref:SUZ RNA-binding domain-containing n=2 Tax=Caerostris TaxID=172845 RepID=A0AAV4SYH1_9ARAC|nr:SUZ domain-containing protein 1 [Caerostris extrusa]GIY38899.1 SUZ domain-containing protein 1 [Caerostris darwini]
MAQDVTDDVCDSWEDMIENGVLEKKIEELQFKAPKNSASEDQSSETLYPQMKLEDNSRTPYMPQVKILKRPNDAKTVVVSEKSPSRHPAKTLKQREAEYAEARLRILGSAHSEEEQSASNSNPLLASSEKKNEAEVIVVRLPRGPDGTNGFVQQR